MDCNVPLNSNLAWRTTPRCLHASLRLPSSSGKIRLIYQVYRRATTLREFADLSAIETVAAVQSRQLSAREIVASTFERVDRLEPVIRAWVVLDRDGALRRAEEIDARLALGDPLPLAGLTVGVKDIIDMAGLPTEAGFAPFHDRVAAADAEIVRRLRDLGAIPLGKTHTTQFAFSDSAPTNNPYLPSHTPGGSSSGSGAAVGAHMVPLALGTQTAGSVLRPAAYCGAVGFKPTFQLDVSLWCAAAVMVARSSWVDHPQRYGHSLYL